MSFRLVFLLQVAVLGFSSAGSSSSKFGCYKELSEPLPSLILTKPPHLYVKADTLPVTYDWRIVNDTCFVSPPTNQFLPSPCGCCWAHAALGALLDRMIITTKAKQPFVPLSSQVLLDCEDPDLGSCHGGSALGAYKFIAKNGVTDITCSPFMGVDNFYWAEIPCSVSMCRKCDRFGNCKFINGKKYYVEEYGTVTGEEQMKLEIFTRGPIACSVYAHSTAFEDYTSGIIQDPEKYNGTTHVVAITGWGKDQSGMGYWIGRNSFGTAWGEEGWFKLQRGVNTLNVESHTCAWAVPKF